MKACQFELGVISPLTIRPTVAWVLKRSNQPMRHRAHQCGEASDVLLAVSTFFFGFEVPNKGLQVLTGDINNDVGGDEVQALYQKMRTNGSGRPASQLNVCLSAAFQTTLAWQKKQARA